jgi:hypothetical protein
MQGAETMSDALQGHIDYMKQLIPFILIIAVSA